MQVTICEIGREILNVRGERYCCVLQGKAQLLISTLELFMNNAEEERGKSRASSRWLFRRLNSKNLQRPQLRKLLTMFRYHGKLTNRLH